MSRNCLLFSAFLLFATSELAGQTTIAQWTFETNTPADLGDATTSTSVTADIGNGSAIGVHASASTDWSTPPGNGSANSFSANNWAVNDYWQFQVNTTGYANISISWSQASSATGPRDFKIQYSTDGTSFTDATGTNSVIQALIMGSPNPAWSSTNNYPVYSYTLNLSSAITINNSATVYFRLVVTSNVSANAGTIAGTGTNRIDDFTVTGFPILYYRSAANGNWNNNATWESSTDNNTWIAATSVPSSSSSYATTISHAITATADITIDETTIQSGGSLIIDPNVTLTINDGTGTDLVISSGGSLRFESDATGTGKLADLGSAIIAQNSNVTVERFIPAKRGWRLLTAPLTGSANNTIFTQWQNNGANDGSGIEIFSPAGTGPSGNGITQSGTASSLRTYNQSTNVYAGVTDTKSEQLFSATTNNSFLVFVTGPYGSTNISSGATATNVDATGNLITGTQSYTFTAPNATNIYQLIGNPFACPIDFDKVYQNTNTDNIEQMFWTIDPNLNTVGGYVTVSWNGVDAYSVVPPSNQNQYIQTGQAFFVEATTANTISTVEIQENDKETSAAQTAIFRTNGGIVETFRINLHKSVNSNFVLIDGVLINGHQSLSNNMGAGDAIKFGNFNENISIYKGNNTWLAIEGRQLLDNNDTIDVSISNMQQTNYQLELVPGNMNVPGLSATLIDHFTNTTTPVSLTSNTTYSFAVTNNSASQGVNRFDIIFTNTTPLDLKFVNIKAARKDEKVNIFWTVNNQESIHTYEVERSIDGKSYEKIASLGVSDHENYSFVDNAPFNGNNYYRIKAIARSTTGIYSNIVQVNMNNTQTELNIHPNPVNGDNLQITINDLAKGHYYINIYNVAGQSVSVKQINYDGGSSGINMNIESLTQGLYLLKLMNKNGESIAEQKLIKQ